MPGSLQETMELVKAALSKSNDEIGKAAGYLQSGSATSGLTFYDLEAPAKTIYPVLTPLRNSIARVSGKGGTQANWRAVTGINTTQVSPGVSEGNRGGGTTHSTADYLAAYRGLGLEDFVTFEADYAARGFDDVKARATEGLLRSLMIQEEAVILGGDTSQLLGTTGTPTLAQVTDSASACTNSGAYSVICVALGFDAMNRLGGFNNGFVGSSIGLAIDPNTIASLTRVNTDGSSDTFGGGVAKKSANATVVVDASHKSIKASVAAVSGAYGYAWYWHPTAGSELLGAITTINSVLITADATTAFTVGANLANDNSTNALIYDGLLTQAFKSGSGSYVKALATGVPGTGTVLTSNGAGGITELDNLFQDRWNLYRLSPDMLWANGQQLLDINNIVVKNGGAPLIRYALDANGQVAIDAGVVVGTILNRITNTKVKIAVHPNLPAGCLFAQSTQLPYKLSGITEVVRILLRQDYYQVEWPRKSRKYEYGVYLDGVLQHYFPPANSLITNIAAGS